MVKTSAIPIFCARAVLGGRRQQCLDLAAVVERGVRQQRDDTLPELAWATAWLGARLAEVAAARTGVAADSAAKLAHNQNFSAAMAVAMAAMLGAPLACKSPCCAPAR